MRAPGEQAKFLSRFKMRAAVSMRRARSVTGPLRRAHPASGATWNVQVVRGKMSTKCLWHACRALAAGLMLMVLGGAMAVIGYYAETLSVAEEIRGNSTISVKDEARGFHLNNLSYAGPIVMGFGGFIVVAACVMTFEARDSAAKVTPARPQTVPRPVPRRCPPCAAPARLDQLGVYGIPHVIPLSHALPHAPPHRRQHSHAHDRKDEKYRYGSAPDLRLTLARPVSVTVLRCPLRRYALSVDEPPHSTFSACAVDSECGSQSSLAMDLHGSGACAGVTLRVRDNTRRRPLARQSRLRDDIISNAGSHVNIDDCLIRINDEKVCENPAVAVNEVRTETVPPASKCQEVQIVINTGPPDISIQIDEAPPFEPELVEEVHDIKEMKEPGVVNECKQISELENDKEHEVCKDLEKVEEVEEIKGELPEETKLPDPEDPPLIEETVSTEPC